MQKIKVKTGQCIGLFTLATLMGSQFPEKQAIAIENSQTLDQISQYSGNDASLTQVNSVFQLRDVSPSDWAFDALRNLVERYNCIVGYPDGTFRGNRSLSRYEFAAGLNACLQQIERLIAGGGSEIGSADIANLNRLVQEFEAELATLGARVDDLEGRTEFLENHQFSTTTKLTGETIFSVADTFGDRTGNNTEDPTELTFAARTRLNFNTSFTGKDLLRVRLQAGNMPGFNSNLTGTNMTRLGFDTNTGNEVRLDDLFYRFPVGSKTTAWLLLNGHGSDNIAPPLSPLSSSGQAAISRFGRFSPVYRMVEGSGVGISHKFSDSLALALTYRTPTNIASDPSESKGLFGGTYGALTQLTFSPSDRFQIGVHYARNYYGAGSVNLTGSTGSNFARQPFGNIATSANSYGLTTSLKISPQVILSGWAAFTNAQSEFGADQDADLFNAAVSLAFPDLFAKGNLGGLIVGIPPKATSNSIAAREDQDTSIHLEAFYRHRVNKNISITPGVLAIFNPEHNSANSTQVAGVVRTTFSF